MRKLISLITLFSFSIQAATITDDKLTVGKKASASAKEIVFDTNDGAANKKLSVDKITKKLSITSDEAIVGDGTASDKALTFNRGGANAQVKWNEVTDKLQFSNDGTTFKDLGTGGGGGGSTGVNVLTNDSFEDAVGGVLTDWSNTGGTLTQQTYTNSVEGDAKYFQFVATGAGQYFEMVKTVPTNFNGQGCQVDFKKMNIATADLFKVEALDASNNVLATGNVKVSSWQKFPTLSFACPAAGATFKIRVTSLAAGTLQGDKAYLGSNQNIVNTSQAKLAGNISWLSNTNCSWSTSSTSFTNYPVDSDCNNPTVSGSVTAPAGKTPSFILNAQPGDYYIVASGLFNQDTATQGAAYFRMSDGTTNSYSQTIYGNGNSGQTTVTGKFSYTSAGLKTIDIQGAVQSASQTASVGLNLTNRDLNISVYYFPSQSETAVSPEQSSWFIDANIGGANKAFTTVLSSYTELNAPSWDMVISSTKGSAPAEIPCTGTTASTGLTCSGVDESMGIVFTPPMPGRYQVCASGTFLTTATAGDGVLQLVETPNNAQTILQEGGTRTAISASSSDVAQSVFQCGNFVFNDTSKRTIRWMHEKPSTASLTPLTDRLASAGQRDFKFTVENITFGQNRPILTGDQVTTPGAQKPKLFSFKFGGASSTTACSSGACTIYKNSGGLLTSATFSATGIYSLVLDTTKFSYLSCVFDHGLADTTANRTCGTVNYNGTSGTMDVRCSSAGSAGNAFPTANCFGVAP